MGWKQQIEYIEVDEVVLPPPVKKLVWNGEDFVPMMLFDFECPDESGYVHWFHALVELTGANPVPFEDRGRVMAMVEHWIIWGRSSKYKSDVEKLTKILQTGLTK